MFIVSKCGYIVDIDGNSAISYPTVCGRHVFPTLKLWLDLFEWNLELCNNTELHLKLVFPAVKMKLHYGKQQWL